jgi:hypothetical protein
MRKVSIPILKSYTVADVTVEIDKILNAPYEDIGEAAESIPAYLGWFGYQKACAAERLINYDYNLKEMEARAYFDLRGGQYVAKGFGEKVTEEGLKKAVILVEEVKAASMKHAKAKKDFDWMNSTIEALRAKLELVRSREATRRMEHEPDKNRHSTE